LESLPQVRQQASALAGQLYKALIHVIVTQRGGHLKGALINADVPQHVGDARLPLEKSRMLEDDAHHGQSRCGNNDGNRGAVVHSQRRSSSSGSV